MLAQGRDLTLRVPAVVLPMPAGAVRDGVWTRFKLLTLRRMQLAPLGKEDTFLRLAQAVSWPWSRENEEVRCWHPQDAL